MRLSLEGSARGTFLSSERKVPLAKTPVSLSRQFTFSILIRFVFPEVPFVMPPVMMMLSSF